MRNLFLLIFSSIVFTSYAQTDTSKLDELVIPIIENGDNLIHSPKSDELYGHAVELETPKFIGGEDSMRRFIKRNLVYPPMAIDSLMEGKVWVRFTVKATGDVTDVYSVDKIKLGFGLEDAAIQVIKKMPKWEPSRSNGKPVSFYMQVPIVFKLH